MPPKTRSPGPTSRGSDSPVIIEVSIAAWPDSMVPSVGIRSPGRTTITSPTTTCPIGTSTSASPRSTVASLAPDSIKARSAVPASRFARCSRYRPSNIKVVTAAATSRKISLLPSPGVPKRDNVIVIPTAPAPPKKRAYSDHPLAERTPNEIRVSIVATPCRALIAAARWKGHAPQITMGKARAATIHCQ